MAKNNEKKQSKKYGLGSIFSGEPRELTFDELVEARKFEMERDILPGFYTVVTKDGKSKKVYSGRVRFNTQVAATA